MLLDLFFVLICRTMSILILILILILIALWSIICGVGSVFIWDVKLSPNINWLHSKVDINHCSIVFGDEKCHEEEWRSKELSSIANLIWKGGNVRKWLRNKLSFVYLDCLRKSKCISWSHFFLLLIIDSQILMHTIWKIQKHQPNILSGCKHHFNVLIR